MKILERIGLVLFFIVSAVSVLICVINQKYEIAIALAGIFTPFSAPFFTKNLELNKYKQEIIINDKCNCYKEIYFYLSTIIEYPFAFYTEQDWSKMSIEVKQKEYLNINASDNDYSYKKYQINLMNALLSYQEKRVNEFQEYIRMNGLYISEDIKNNIKILIDLVRKERANISNEINNTNTENKVKNQILLIKSKLQKELDLKE